MKKEKVKEDLRRLTDAYNLIVNGIDHEAEQSEERAYSQAKGWPMKKREEGMKVINKFVISGVNKTCQTSA